MKLHVYTLALDSLPFIEQQYEILKATNLDFVWHVIEGVADSVLDTSWVKKIQPRFSRDGTTEFLNKISNEQNVRIYRKQLWNGKTEMCNAAIGSIKEECVLIQMDSDEMWEPQQLEKIVHIFKTQKPDSMRFLCKYYLGREIIATGRNCWSNRDGEWHRAWHFKPGMLAAKHEPPILQGCGRNCMTREQTEELGLVFHHLAYTLRKQVEFKQNYYGYTGLVEQWERLQKNTVWPVKRLADYFPFVGEGVGADFD